MNGQVVLREGDTLPSGQVIGVVFGVDLSTDGSTAWTHRTDPGSSAE